MLDSIEPEPDPAESQLREFDERREALQRISDRIQQLQAELDSLNERAPRHPTG